jgi:hypothetical protein
MSRRRTIATQQIHADWWDGHEVVVIRSLRAEDTDWVQDQLAEMVTGKGKDASMALKLGTTKRLTTLRGVVSWTFTDELGNPQPFNEDALRMLAPEDADYIYGEINKLNQPMSEEEKKASLTNVNGGSQGIPPLSLVQ